ncbi:hypothetical protein [Streptomyces lomondensis]|uniref:Integral membrane protein n=1 Tax=Streptomyces lomondensis TaxID=68229 RepID=A0ABQ2XN73_9ACTN|nr:hypothetical protein [Streptomyces lomondensis]MCF0081025.1 hypothetical protein [Streptomyces lomondensis]GGX25833.1 hypothetical protein GCM10010383_65210 [Streptomyces lomondensis]
MYGHGAAPPPRSAATVISLRVLFAAAGFLTCGLLACAPLFRVAVLRGRVLDWVLAWVSLPVSLACFAVIGVLPEGDARTDIALALVLLVGMGATIHFLVVDISHHSGQRQFAGYAPPHAPTAHSPYGYPHPAPPYGPTATPTPQPPAPHTPVPRDATPQGPGPVQPPPSPQRPAPARIDRVRAELDELSDYLRRHEGEGHRDGTHESGR